MRRLILPWLLILLTACTAPAGPASTVVPTQIPAATATANLAPSPRPAAPPATIPLDLNTVEGLTYLVPLQPTVKERQLDVYSPTAPGPWPVVIVAHGYASKRSGYRLLSQAIAEQGAVVFNVDWNAFATPSSALSGQGATVREWVESLACAVRFARATAPAYGGDPQRVTLVGHSMGGGVGLIAALAGDNIQPAWDALAAERGGPPPQVGCAASAGSAFPEAFVSYGGAFMLADSARAENPELIALLDPTQYLGTKPGLVVRFIQGQRDSIIAPEGVETARQLLTMLVDAGYDAQWVDVDSGHGLSASGEAGAAIVQTVMEAAHR